MESNTLRSIQRVPLHLVGGILAQLDSMHQLAAAIKSHRLFLEAFTDNVHTITASIVLNQIPEGLLPFAIAVQRSTEIDAADHDAVRTLLSNLEAALSGPRSTVSSLTSFTPAQVATMSKTYRATERLCQHYVDDVIPIANERLQINHSRTINQGETFRLGRAFLRYQLLCNLFCHGKGKPFPDEEREGRFFSNFSPWVNEQLTCVYYYLEAKVAEGKFGFILLATRS